MCPIWHQIQSLYIVCLITVPRFGRAQGCVFETLRIPQGFRFETLGISQGCRSATLRYSSRLRFCEFAVVFMVAVCDRGFFLSRLATSRCFSLSLFCDIAVVAFLLHFIVLRLYRLHYPTMMRSRSFPRLRNFTTVLFRSEDDFVIFVVFITANLRLNCHVNPHARIFANPRNAWARKLATYEPRPQT